MSFNFLFKTPLKRKIYCVVFLVLLSLWVNIIQCETIAQILTLNNFSRASGTTINQVNLKSAFIAKSTEVEKNCIVGANACNLKCKETKSDAALIAKLENQYNICGDVMELVLDEAYFTENMFKQTDLKGKFRLHTLTLKSCNIEYIENNAFDKASMYNLANLRIISSNLKHMNADSFVGLENLSTLEIINNATDNGELETSGMLKPLEDTLGELIFQHNSTVLLKDFDPGLWLEGAVLKALRQVCFNGNYFTKKLNRNSFLALKAVVILQMRYCSINFLMADTFDAILKTLRFLDLSFNEIKTLSPHFLNNAAKFNIKLNVESNQWDCNCENVEFMKAISNEVLNIMPAPKCMTPESFKFIDLWLAQICCLGDYQACVEYVTSTTPAIDWKTEKYIDSEFTVDLSCKNATSVNQFLKLTVKDNLLNFVITDLSEKDLLIVIKDLPAVAELLYFESNNYDSYEVKTLYDDSKVVSNLNPNQCYVFCVLPTMEKPDSSYKCRSHHMGAQQLNIGHQVWLSRENKIVFITLVTLSNIFWCLIGLISTYMLVRWRPTVLTPHRRLDVLHSNKNQVHLKSSCSKMTADDMYKNLRKTNLDSIDYVQYYRSNQLPTMKIKATNLYGLSYPNQRAPALPPLNKIRHTWLESTKSADDIFFLDSRTDALNEHDYQSLGEYQQIYEVINLEKENQDI